MSIDNFQVDNETSLYVVYAKYFGEEINGNYIYHFYLSNNPDDVFAEGWGESPACNVSDKLMDLDDDQYQNIIELKSNIKLDLARNCCCFTMQDCRDNIIALAYENLDDAEEYPEPRIIIHFGDLIDDVEDLFAQRNILLKYI